MNKDWSDDEDNIDNNVELIQPSRDFPISDEENEEEDEYDMYELTKLTMTNTSDDLFQTKLDKSEKKNKIKEVKIDKNINMNTFIWNKEVKKTERKEIRKF